MTAKTKEWIDITGKIGPLYPETTQSPEWPMYSYSRPAYEFWNGVAQAMQERGWTEKQIQAWLQSKSPRWELDQEWSEKIESLGYELGKGAEKL